MERQDKGQDIVLVASEPLTFERADWVTVPSNCISRLNFTNHSDTHHQRPNGPFTSYCWYVDILHC